jgi:AcrR family transcriptional regulator
MKSSEQVRQKIIDVTIDLINNSNGAIEAITTRSISQKAGIGVGLINYHFQTKENLIEICVQKIIGNV